jgi:predicted DNA-binding protein
MEGQEGIEDLQEYRVRLPKEIIEKLPKAKIVARKSIQLMVREAIEAHFKRLNL